MLLLDYGSGFKDELVATAIVLAVTVGGSFYLLHRFSGETIDSTQNSQTVLGLTTEDSGNTPSEATANSATSKQAGPTPIATPLSTPTPEPTASPSATPEPARVEIPYGSDQTFENGEYKISFKSPKMITGESKTFMVEVVIGNKDVDGEGLSNAILATITKDGKVVADNVPLSLSETKPIKIGQQLTFTATLSMIPGTDITKLEFKPIGGVVPTTFNLASI